jgi:cytochrome bd-type quinol oxidase subunit 2
VRRLTTGTMQGDWTLLIRRGLPHHCSRPGAGSAVLRKGEKVVFIEMVAAVLTVVFVVLPGRGVIGRNAFVGVRTRATMRSAAAWRRGHQAAVLPTSIAAGGVVTLGTAAAVTGRMNDVSAVIACAAVLLAGGSWSVAAARRAVRQATSCFATMAPIGRIVAGGDAIGNATHRSDGSRASRPY